MPVPTNPLLTSPTTRSAPIHVLDRPSRIDRPRPVSPCRTPPGLPRPLRLPVPRPCRPGPHRQAAPTPADLTSAPFDPGLSDLPFPRLPAHTTTTGHVTPRQANSDPYRLPDPAPLRSARPSATSHPPAAPLLPGPASTNRPRPALPFPIHADNPRHPQPAPFLSDPSARTEPHPACPVPLRLPHPAHPARIGPALNDHPNSGHPTHSDCPNHPTPDRPLTTTRPSPVPSIPFRQPFPRQPISVLIGPQ